MLENALRYTLKFHAGGGTFVDSNDPVFTTRVSAASAGPKMYFHHTDKTKYWDFKGWTTVPPLPGDENPYIYVADMTILSFPLDASKGTEFYAVWEERDVSAGVETDWLFLAYLSADNNLNDAIWADMNEMEAGLYQSDGSARIKVAALWDGSPIYGGNHPHTALYELGPDTNASALGLPATLNMSDPEYGFFKDTGLSPDLKIDGRYELDMSNPQILTRFLQWADSRYDAKYTVLITGGHGAGPRSARSLDGALYWNPLYRSGRAMLSDDTNGGTTMKSGEFAQAVTDAGMTINVMLLDVCLGASVEDAYEFRNTAEYLVVSPGDIPAAGSNYLKLIGGITAASTPETVGIKLVDDYKGDYQNDSSLAAAVAGLTCVDLSQVNALATTINALASSLLSAGTGYRDAAMNSTSYPHYGLVMDKGATLYDLGTMLDRIKSAASEDSGSPVPDAVDVVKAAMEAAVVCAWSRSIPYDGKGIPFGLTIIGHTSPTALGGYTTELAFGKPPSNWAELLKAWF
ncbi:MAG: hypothetical protein LBS64_06200 [Spirochaetaceae bacterium]|nr:hypothetical protein [Spirochaetaceae bacterium]